MGNFSRDSRGGGGRSFGGPRRDFGGRPSFSRGGGFGRGRNDDRQMFKTVCSNCGNECEVPFRPTSGKPVYCSDCFEKMGGGRSDSPRPERSDFRAQSPSFDQNRDQFASLNSKLDKIISLLEPKVEKVEMVDAEKTKPAKVKKVTLKIPPIDEV